MWSVRRGLKSRRGQAIMEFVVIFPIILVLLATIVDFGIAFDRRIVLQHAVAEAARRGAVEPDIAATIAHAEAQSQGLLDTSAEPDAVTVCFTDENGDGRYGQVGDSIVVQADFDYAFSFLGVLGLVGASSPGSVNLNPAATKRLETSVGLSVGASNAC